MMMYSSLFVTLCFMLFSALSSTEALRNKAETLTPEEERQLQRMDREFPEDICKNGENDYGPCDENKFPNCPRGTQICYNRKPFKDRFFDSDRQPKYYIDYGLVFCYPDNFEACSSCTPGRYCLAEGRCVLDEVGYPCERWL